MLSDAPAVAKKLKRCFGLSGDCQVVVRSSNSAQEGEQSGDRPEQVFLVWSDLLASWSDVFAAMFSNDCRERAEKKIEIVDFSLAAVDAFLRFLYSGDLPVESRILVEVTAMADKYAVPQLLELCGKGIGRHLKPETACEMLEACDHVHLPELRKTSLELIWSRPMLALPRIFMLKSSVLEEVLSSPQLLVGDYPLAEIILRLAQNPEAAAYRGEVPALLKRHVHFAALNDHEQGKIKSLAETAGCLTEVQEMMACSKGGMYTKDVFGKLWATYSKMFAPGSARPPFLGWWLNLIPSGVSFSSGQSQEDLARGASNISLSEGEECTWLMPHHYVHVKSICFTPELDDSVHIQISSSTDGVAWVMVMDTEVKQFLGGKIYSCRSKGAAMWLKLRVVRGTYDNILAIGGNLYTR